MSGIQATLTHPITRQDGSPFNPATDLDHVLLEERLQGATVWTKVGADMLPAELTRTIQNTPGGTWQLQATWVDKAARASPVASAVLTVPMSGPNAGTLTLTLV